MTADSETELKLLREALDRLPCGVSVYDPTGRPILHNDLTRKRFPALFEVYDNGAKGSDRRLRVGGECLGAVSLKGCSVLSRCFSEKSGEVRPNCFSWRPMPGS